ncbi:PAP1-domain-containing protein [Aureobasidium pullulans]|uniref:PAP1-domain-containing protein n=1 Tax=Aureobasidium pullulans TaxID=5580 RepID=A0AB74JS39_AURPU|nr:PAP1-domain-containing protein [Aureobasidium pullulans]THX35251.1 PAP1-domain-containing protein [Aureobasidium pullulans]
MAGQTTGNQPFNPYLSNAQQELLLAALASNNPSGNREKNKPSADMNALEFEDTSPYLDYLDGDTSFDFDASDLGGQHMFDNMGSNASNKSDSTDGGDKPDKRKSPEEDSLDDENDAKRREGEPKEAKKPGRKPLTSEPTTKRKAQNRAAQRAFRERKEKHLKDLETKVDALSKAQEQDKHENGVLRAQVQRLQAELGEYKKRMSYSSGGIASHSPPSAARGVSRSNSNSQTDFQFDFPKFGALPGNQLFGNNVQSSREKTVSPPAGQHASLPRSNSMARNPSPGTHMSNHPLSPGNNSRSGSMNKGTNSPLAQISATGTTYADLFSPSTLGNLNSADFLMQNNNNNNNTDARAFAQYADNGTDSTSGISRVFRFNSGSGSGSGTNSNQSPSVPSLTHYNTNSCNTSSCGTSPESANSPPSDVNKTGVNDFNDIYSLKPVNSNNTQSKHFIDVRFERKADTIAESAQNGGLTNASTPGFDWLATQNGGQFDPVLFGDYRESQDAIVGDGDFNSGFFEAAFPYDLNTPFAMNDFSSPKSAQQTSASANLLAEVEKCREGGDDDMYLPQQAPTQQSQQQINEMSLKAAEKMLNCNTIWCVVTKANNPFIDTNTSPRSQLQSNQDFKEGKFDLDNLCAELRAKAKCSESGVTVPSEYVDAAFKKLSGTNEQPPLDDYHATHTTKGIDYLFNQYSVDEALKKLAGQ